RTAGNSTGAIVNTNASGVAWRSWCFFIGDGMDSKHGTMLLLCGAAALSACASKSALKRPPPAPATVETITPVPVAVSSGAPTVYYAGSIGSVAPSTATSAATLTSTNAKKTSEVGISSGTWRTLPNTAFQAGEDLFFTVKWGIITGGNSTLAVH